MNERCRTTAPVLHGRIRVEDLRLVRAGARVLEQAVLRTADGIAQAGIRERKRRGAVHAKADRR